MLEYQKHQLNLAMKELGTNSFQFGDIKKSDTGSKGNKNSGNMNEDCMKELERKLMNVKSMQPSAE